MVNFFFALSIFYAQNKTFDAVNFYASIFLYSPDETVSHCETRNVNNFVILHNSRTKKNNVPS